MGIPEAEIHMLMALLGVTPEKYPGKNTHVYKHLKFKLFIHKINTAESTLAKKYYLIYRPKYAPVYPEVSLTTNSVTEILETITEAITY